MPQSPWQARTPSPERRSGGMTGATADRSSVPGLRGIAWKSHVRLSRAAAIAVPRSLVAATAENPAGTDQGRDHQGTRRGITTLILADLRPVRPSTPARFGNVRVCGCGANHRRPMTSRPVRRTGWWSRERSSDAPGTSSWRRVHGPRPARLAASASASGPPPALPEHGRIGDRRHAVGSRLTTRRVGRRRPCRPGSFLRRSTSASPLPSRSTGPAIRTRP